MARKEMLFRTRNSQSLPEKNHLTNYCLYKGDSTNRIRHVYIAVCSTLVSYFTSAIQKGKFRGLSEKFQLAVTRLSSSKFHFFGGLIWDQRVNIHQYANATTTA